jgi:creatinine amidohydrolase
MKLVEMSAPEVGAAARNAVAILPLAAIEQHGPHLAVSTDSAIVTTIAETVEAKLPKVVVLCPTLHFGSSHHHLNFGGTLSISAKLYTDVVVDLVESLLESGFRRIVLLNGHGGNITPVKQALSILSHRHDDTPQPNIALATYWEVGGQAFAGRTPMKTPALSHACEYETSMMLHLYPERVKKSQARRGKRPKSNGYIPWEDDEPSRGVTLTKRTHFISDTGASGDPRLASAEKGTLLVGIAVNSVATFIGQFRTWPPMKSLARNKR